MTIKEVEVLTGLTRKTIRFYESRGLLRPSRRGNNYRDYTEADVERLRKIALLRRMDISLDNIQKLFDDEMTLQDAIAQTQEKLKIQLGQLEGALTLCERMNENGERMDMLSVEKYERMIAELEGEGKWFRDLVEDLMGTESYLVTPFDPVWECIGIPKRYWFLIGFMEWEIFGLTGWAVLEVVAPYRSSLWNDLLLIELIIVPIWYCFFSLLKLSTQLRVKKFPEGREKEKLAIQLFRWLLIGIYIVIVLWRFWIWLIGYE